MYFRFYLRKTERQCFPRTEVTTLVLLLPAHLLLLDVTKCRSFDRWRMCIITVKPICTYCSVRPVKIKSDFMVSCSMSTWYCWYFTFLLHNISTFYSNPSHSHITWGIVVSSLSFLLLMRLPLHRLGTLLLLGLLCSTLLDFLRLFSQK